MYKGSSFLRFATLKIIGFDAFGRFRQGTDDKNDRDFIRRFSAERGDGISRDFFIEVLSHMGFGNIELVEQIM